MPAGVWAGGIQVPVLVSIRRKGKSRSCIGSSMYVSLFYPGAVTSRDSFEFRVYMYRLTPTYGDVFVDCL